MLHLRLIVAAELARPVVDGLRQTAGVAHLAHLPGVSTSPPGDVVLCDVVREYAPVSALCVNAARRRWAGVGGASRTLVLGLLVAAVAALVATLVFRATGLAPGRYGDSGGELTEFISRPDGMAAVVAVLAGVVGMLSLTEARSGALIGVLVSVTTIPAVGNIGVATAYGGWSELRGACLQLVINVVGLVVAGIVTLSVQSRMTTMRIRGPRTRRAWRSPEPG